MNRFSRVEVQVPLPPTNLGWHPADLRGVTRPAVPLDIVSVLAGCSRTRTGFELLAVEGLDWMAQTSMTVGRLTLLGTAPIRALGMRVLGGFSLGENQNPDHFGFLEICATGAGCAILIIPTFLLAILADVGLAPISRQLAAIAFNVLFWVGCLWIAGTVVLSFVAYGLVRARRTARGR